jgi:hypothetical protein
LSLEAPRVSFWDVPEDAATGAWAARRELADALRSLIASCVGADASEAELREAAHKARGLADSLAIHPRKHFIHAHRQASAASELHEFADRGVFVGRCNPQAPPMRFHHANGVSIGEVTFGVAFEGAPDWVHGGIVAAAFDQLFGHLQVALETPSFTGRLTVHYRKPTPLDTLLRFEGRRTRHEGVKSVVTGQCFAGDVLTAEAEGLFIAVDPARMRQMVGPQGKEP